VARRAETLEQVEAALEVALSNLHELAIFSRLDALVTEEPEVWAGATRWGLHRGLHRGLHKGLHRGK
jgi:hypothetical protein